MKPLIIITGMHRSGTSFLVRSLNLSGMYLGETKSLTSHEWNYLEDNLRGHWENQEILNLAEKTLKNNQGSWDEIPSHIEIDKTLGKEIQNYLNKLSKEPSLAYGFKDPRIILCFESWKKYIPRNFVLIGIFRDPLKVAESLKKRNGFNYEKSLDLWKIYNTRLLELLEKYNGFLINFDQPKQEIFSEINLITKKLGLLNPLKLSDWYTEELLHSDKSFKSNFILDDEIKTLYSNLIKRSKNNSKVNFKNFDKIEKGNLDVISSLISQSYDQSKSFRNELDKIKDELSTTSNNLFNLQKEFDDRTTWANELNVQFKGKDEKILSLQKEFDDRTIRVDELTAQIKGKDEKIASLEVEKSKAKQLQEEIKSEQSKAKQLQGEIKSEQSKAKQLQEEIKSEQSKAKQLQEEILKAQGTIENSEKIISIKEKHVEDISSQFYERSYELDQIKRSIIYGGSLKIAHFLDKLFPASTKRGNFLNMLRMGFLIYRNEGWNSLKLAASEKFKRGKLAKAKNTSPNLVSSILVKSKEKNLFENIQDSCPDSSLRDHVHFNSHKITNLTNYPKISIIIPTFDQVHLLKKNLDSIKSKSTYQNYEIILITNNTDKNSEMRKFLNSTDCLVLVYENEYSFSGINNFAASKASGDFLLFLNDDVEINTPNWLESLLSLGLRKKTGAVGAKLLFPDGKLQEAGCIVWRQGNAWNFGRNQDPELPDFNFVREVDYCSGCCLFVKKSLFDEIGGFNTDFDPAYYEDVDLCFNLRSKGYSVLYQPLASIIHFEGMTQGTSTDKGIKSYQITNQQKFAKKWNHVLQNHLEDSMDNSYFERNRKDGLNILYIDHYNPEPDKDSGSLRTFNMISILSHMNNKITFWPDNLFKSEPYTTEMQQKGIEVIYGPHDFKSFLNSRKKLFDVVFIARPYIASKYIDIIKNHDSSCKIVYDTTDLHFLRMKRQQTFDKKVSDSEINQMHDLELSLMRTSNVTILTSEIEQQILKKEDPSINFAIIPNVHTTENDIPDFENRKDLMFLGGFQHPPNVDSVKYLAEEIFPEIHKKYPDIKLYIVGSNPPKEITSLQSKNFLVTGYQHDISPYLKKCRLMLTPLRFGAGVKGKITQSLAFGLPVVTSSIGSEGINLVDGENCMIANDTDDFVKKTISLYDDKKTWEKFSKNGLKTAELYSPETIRLTLKKILTDF